MGRQPLYQDSLIKVEKHPTSIDDHILSINEGKTGWRKYLLQRGILEELAKTPVAAAVNKVKTINEFILKSLETDSMSGHVGLNFLYLHTVLRTAYAAEEKSRQEYVEKMRNQRDAKLVSS